MNVLMLTPRCPYPPNRGDTLRTWAMLEYLGQRHAVWLATLAERPPTAAGSARMRRLCRELAIVPHRRGAALLRGALNLLVRGGSFCAGYFAVPALARTVRQWSRRTEFDAVLSFSAVMAPPAEPASARHVLDLCDVDSQKWVAYARQTPAPLRWLCVWEARRLLAFERRCVGGADLTLLVNERERRKAMRLLAASGGAARFGVLRTCVPLHETGSPEGESGVNHAPAVGTIGSMFYRPNVQAVLWFARDVWPRVRQAVPQATWRIVGSRPTRAVRRLARLTGVTVTGFVPDIRPELERLRVFVNPVTGDLGVQSKLLVALAAGKPAVVSPDAAAGIDYCGQPPFLVARSAEQFAAAVVRLLRDDGLAAELSRRARAVIAEHYEPARQLAQLEAWLAGKPCQTPTPCPVGTEVSA